LYFFKHLSELEEEPSELKGTIFDKLFESAKTEELTETEMEAYKESILDNVYVKRSMALYRKEEREKGKKIGLERGMNRRNYEIARNMLNLHMSISDIVKVTGLTPEEILNIQ
jgi:predicted transposase/invertase (TIGR01784 family)